jgi:alpha-tubulin suppressor-like RCC1 family protein
LQTDGVLMCWGSCGAQLEHGGTDVECFTPRNADEDGGLYTYVDAGIGHTCALSGGKVFCFGNNGDGQLGNRGGDDAFDLFEIAGYDQWTSVTAGLGFTCGIRGETNEAWCWGNNERGQLGDGGGGVVLEPTLVDSRPYDKLHLDDQTGCAIRTDATLWCWGSNSFGQLGDGTTFERRRPVQIGTDADWLAVATARTSACGIRAPGTLWCWGNNEDTQLGIGGTPVQAEVPTQVGPQAGWSEVAVGITNACGVLDDMLHCWGRDSSAFPESLGVAARSLTAFADRYGAITATDQASLFGVFEDPTTQIESPGIADWITFVRGQDHFCGVRSNMTVFCGGGSFDGQLGIQDTNTQVVAVQEETMGARWVHVSTGDHATCAIDLDGALFCTGLEGLIGNGPRGTLHQLTRIGTAFWKTVDVGDDSACGIQIDGSLHCWGAGNTSGRGDGRGGHERPTRVAPPQ